MFRRDRHFAAVSGPFYGHSTHYKHGDRGIRVTLYRVTVGGQHVYHAPAKYICEQWLTMQGYVRTTE